MADDHMMSTEEMARVKAVFGALEELSRGDIDGNNLCSDSLRALQTLRRVASAEHKRVAALMNILDGRTTAPTDKETLVLVQHGGRWRWRYRVGPTMHTGYADTSKEVGLVMYGARSHPVTWHALDSEDRLKAWPDAQTVTSIEKDEA